VPAFSIQERTQVSWLSSQRTKCDYTTAIWDANTTMIITRNDTNERASKSVIYNGVAYLSGQVPADADAGIQDQTQSTLDRIDAILKDIGSRRENIISATVYLRDIDRHFALMNEIWNNWIPTGHAPARACVEAHMARPALLVEISIIAAVE